MKTASEMRIRDFEVWVNLGCSPEEQAIKQPVLFQITIEFSSQVLAETTDKIDDSIDYVELMNRIKNESEKKIYHMIEHLCATVTNDLRAYLHSRGVRGHMTVQLLKKRVPVENLMTGAEWVCRTQL